MPRKIKKEAVNELPQTISIRMPPYLVKYFRHRAIENDRNFSQEVISILKDIRENDNN